MCTVCVRILTRIFPERRDAVVLETRRQVPSIQCVTWRGIFFFFLIRISIPLETYMGTGAAVVSSTQLNYIRKDTMAEPECG